MRARPSIPCLQKYVNISHLGGCTSHLIIPTPDLNVVSKVYSLTHIPADSVHMHASRIVYVILK